ncbi:MAG TPA: translocation/assembly module TamB domain-containing protein [Kiritimatiellia bacterium]|nr:translocation/assembly module TamB domain-containing protein [Kiritimatiellia bacterium]
MVIRKVSTIVLWLNRLIGAGALAAVLLLGGGYLWLHSDRGQVWLADTLREATGNGVTLTGLGGRLPWWVTAERLELRDSTDAAWLTAEDLRVTLAWRALRHRRIALDQVSARRLLMANIPNYRGESEHDAPDEPDTSATGEREPLLREIRVDRVTVKDFVFHKRIIGHEIAAALDGAFQWFPGGLMTARLDADLNDNRPFPSRWSIHFEREGGELRFPELVIRSADGGDTLSASGRYTPRTQALDARVEARISDATTYHRLHGLDLAGDITITLEAEHPGRNEPWQLAWTGASETLRYGTVESRGLVATGTVSFAGDGMGYGIEAHADGLAMPGWTLDATDLRAGGETRRHDITARTSGRRGDHEAIEAAATVQLTLGPESGAWSAAFTALDGRWNGLHLYAGEPVDIVFRDDRFTVSVPTLLADDILVKGRTVMVGGALDEGALQAYPIDLARISAALGENAPAMAGEASLNLVFSRLRDQPAGQASLRADHVMIDYGFLHHFEHTTIRADASFDAERLKTQVAFDHPLIRHFVLQASAGLEPREGPVPLGIHWAGGLDAQLSLAASLRALSESILTSPLALSGEIEAEISACNLPHAPDFDGVFTWQNGQLRNLTTGTFLDQVDVRLRGDGPGWRIESATARDGGRGTVVAEGAVAFDQGWEPTWRLEVSLDRATLFRLIQTELPLSGRIESNGGPDGARLEGELWLEPFRFAIPRRLPPSIRELDVVEINHPDPARNTATDPRPQETAQAAEPSPGRGIDLNVRMRTRRGFEVSGRGLQSEWRADLRLTGSSRAPELTGSARVTRGHAMLLGRRFNLDEGRIEFTGPVPPNPQINVSASTPVADIIARLEVNGPANRPVVRLISDPMLPEDEVMAMILFGKSLETMTPWQAIALANGLRILGGGGGDVVNIIDSSQSLLRVDQIDIRQDEEGEGFSSVAIGKYFGRRLYVEGEKGFGDAEDTVTVTLELTPRLTLETETSPRIREGISLFWRKDL